VACTLDPRVTSPFVYVSRDILTQPSKVSQDHPHALYTKVVKLFKHGAILTVPSMEF